MEKAPAVNILLVDDQPGNLLALEAVLAVLGQNLVRASSGTEALKRLLEDNFALILLDVQMPGMNGLETAELIRQRDKTRQVPIIFLTAYERNDALWLRGYELGAVDFIFKPIVPELLRAKVRVFVELEQKTEQLRASQVRELERRLAEERHQWEMNRARQDNEEMARLYHEIQESDRRKDEFLAMLAHELRNPLAPIRNALHILRMGGCQGLNADQAREMAERQVAHLARLVDDLLDVARISRGKITLDKEPTDLTVLVSRAIESARPMIETRRHQLEVQVPPGPLWLNADPLRIEQVLVNLLNNAAKYTQPGGRIWLQVEKGGDSPPGEVAVRVRDNGVGIAPELLPAVFDLFVQADRSLDRSQGGLGVGLALVKNLVKMHGGSVQAISAGPDQGSEFVVRLPLTAPPGLVAAPGGMQPNAAAARRVLVVDDNVDAAQSLALLLQTTGHEVQTSHDGVAALEQARAWQPDAVLLDIGLPRMDGYEVARRLREDIRLRNMLLIALTGYGQQGDRALSREAGFDAHLTKPIDIAELEVLLAHRRNGS